jgi:predicted transcriptional regulator of viral defense system
MDKSSLRIPISSWRGFRLESLLRIHTISKEVKIERNTITLLKAAGDHASRLGVFRARDMVVAGYPREYLRRLVSQEQVRQLGRGLYASAGFDGDQNQSLVEAAKRVPRGVVCLVSALQFHGIGTQSPHQVWLALPRGSNRPRGVNLPLRFAQFSGSAYSFGIEEHALAGGTVRVTRLRRRWPTASSIGKNTASMLRSRRCGKAGGERNSP